MNTRFHCSSRRGSRMAELQAQRARRLVERALEDRHEARSALASALRARAHVGEHEQALVVALAPGGSRVEAVDVRRRRPRPLERRSCGSAQVDALAALGVEAVQLERCEPPCADRSPRSRARVAAPPPVGEQRERDARGRQRRPSRLRPECTHETPSAPASARSSGTTSSSASAPSPPCAAARTSEPQTATVQTPACTSPTSPAACRCCSDRSSARRLTAARARPAGVSAWAARTTAQRDASTGRAAFFDALEHRRAATRARQHLGRR